jgi:hypothetical protein
MEKLEAEKAAPRKRRRLFVKERFISLLFPHTIKYRSKKAKEVKKRRSVSDQKGKQVGEEEVCVSDQRKYSSIGYS